ncbi:MAG: hypothetical protein Q9166_001551 [cf. Caloplaca sp. 2 TL-2023]
MSPNLLLLDTERQREVHQRAGTHLLLAVIAGFDRYIDLNAAGTRRLEAAPAKKQEDWGFGVCVAGIVRFFYIRQIVPFDATWTQVDPAIWSSVEPSIGIVSACLPIMGPIFRTRLTEIRSTSRFSRSKSGTANRSGAPDGGLAAQKNMQTPEKPAPAAMVYTKSRDTSDEEMAMPLRDIKPQPRR